MIYLMQTTNQNLILGFVPESVGILIFGIALVGLTVALRWVFKKGEEKSNKRSGAAKG